MKVNIFLSIYSYSSNMDLSSFILYPIILLLQLKTYKVKSEKEPCIGINIRELDVISSTKCLPYIHLANCCSNHLPEWHL